MTEKISTTISLDAVLFKTVEQIAQQRNISVGDLLEMALADWAAEQAERESSGFIERGQRALKQGDVYWLALSETGSAVPHPYVIVQDDLFNQSRISSVVVCALTSNVRRVSMPGNVLLEAGEANLPKPSVVEVSKVSAVEKGQLGEYIGTVSGERVQQILAGMRFLQTSFFGR